MIARDYCISATQLQVQSNEGCSSMSRGWVVVPAGTRAAAAAMAVPDLKFGMSINK
jgi:hypothetical protein